MIMIKGLRLPDLFEQLTEPIRARNEVAECYRLKQEVDAYGRFWESELDLYGDLERIEDRTRAEEYDFQERYEEAISTYGPKNENKPGFIPYIFDFSQIVCIGRSGGDNPHCLDFRDDPDEPSVIYWQYDHWRRVAPNLGHSWSCSNQ
jgi:hypothetical protein